MPGETVKLQVELVEKNAEARLKALDKLAKEMGNRKITLNFDEASLARWKAATDNMSAAQISAYAKLATAAENASAKMIAAGQKTTQVEMQQNAKLAIDRQKSFDKKIALYEKEDTKRRQIAEKTAQAEINANAKIQVATLKGVQGTRQQTQAQRELNAEANKTSSIFSSITQRFTAANLISAAVTRGITLLRTALRQAVDEMKEMDKELTTIKMVTGASDMDISALRQQAFAGARDTGRTTSDYLSAAERFARAGYRENIQDLTKLSLVTQNVGGVTEDVASKFILAADAAWKMGGSTERLWAMLDGVTAIADQNATDIGKIAEAYTVAGSAFANAGESERTFAALIGTTTAATQRSGSEMARGLQTILFRVRQVKGELDDGEIINAEDISNAAKALDSVGISVLNDNKQLKSFSEIMGELAKIWPELDKNIEKYGIGARERLQNALAGNRRGNVLFSLMDNWDVFEEQLSQFDEASGTALEKNAIYTDSWQSKTNDLKTAWTSLVDTMTGSGGILQDFLTLTTQIIDKINEYANRNQAGDGFELYKGQNQIDSIREEYLERHPYGPDGPVYFGEIGAERNAGRAVESIKAEEEAQNGFVEKQEEITRAILETNKVYIDEAEAVDQLSTAFKNASENIQKAAENMKAEKDDSIKSAADIYKAMKDAADKGYYGSNAYKEGAKLFFGTSDKSVIGKIAQDALDTYFDAIAKGDYSNAAATLWGNFADESGKIVDKTTGEVIASMTDLGDAYRWAFNKGEQSMDDFLTSMQSSTGIGKDFWAAMIQSLGMYSEEMDQWMEDNKELPEEAALHVKTDSAEEEVQSAVDEINRMLDGIQDKEVRINIVQTISGMSTEAAMRAAADAYHNNRSYAWSGYGKAGGKHDNYSGIALVNDEFPADGSKPELIISKSQGRAYIANGGKPALVNLRSDDVVLTAKETESAMGGIPTFEDGKEDTGGALLGGLLKVIAESFGVTSPKDGSEDNKKNNSGKKKPDADKTWAELKKLIEYLLDKAEGDLKDQLKVLDDMLEEMENSRKAEQEAKKLEELQTAAQEALVDLQRAQTERTVRYYNEETQQWEWMADQGSVEKAQEAYNNALDKLKEYEDDLAYEAKKAEIEAQKDALQEQYNLMKDGWDDIVDAIEAPSGDIEKLLNTLIQYGTPTMQEQSGGIADLLNKLRDGLFGAGYDLGLGNINANTKNSGTTSSTVFDDGGFAYGSGMMRKGSGTETVIGPGLTREILNPVKNERFSSFVDSLRYLVDGGNGSFSFGNRSSITNNNGGNYYVNGVRVGSDMAQRPFAEVMKTIAIHANESL